MKLKQLHNLQLSKKQLSKYIIYYGKWLFLKKRKSIRPRMKKNLDKQIVANSISFRHFDLFFEYTGWVKKNVWLAAPGAI